MEIDFFLVSCEDHDMIRAGKTKKIELRVSSEDKEIIESAAQVNALSTSQFILSQVLPISRNIVEDEHSIYVHPGTMKSLLAKLDEPAKTNKTLKRAISKGTVFDG